MLFLYYFFFFQAEDGIRDYKVTGVQTCALPIYPYAQLIQLSPGRLGGDREQDHQRQAGEVADPCDECEQGRSEEHTSELQSPCNLVCRLLLEKKKKTKNTRERSTAALITQHNIATAST